MRATDPRMLLSILVMLVAHMAQAQEQAYTYQALFTGWMEDSHKRLHVALTEDIERIHEVKVDPLRHAVTFTTDQPMDHATFQQRVDHTGLRVIRFSDPDAGRDPAAQETWLRDHEEEFRIYRTELGNNAPE